jgi:hypothetical protein
MANRCDAHRHVWDRDATDPGDTCTCGMWYRWPDRIEYALDEEEDEDPPATEETDE